MYYYLRSASLALARAVSLESGTLTWQRDSVTAAAVFLAAVVVLAVVFLGSRNRALILAVQCMVLPATLTAAGRCVAEAGASKAVALVTIFFFFFFFFFKNKLFITGLVSITPPPPAANREWNGSGPLRG
jgi:hypothetical protein